MKARTLIGRQDLADFPGLQLENIEVKVDTGAYTSSFHCHDIEEISLAGTKKLRCFFLDPEHEKYHNKEFIFDRFSKKKVRSSNGQLEERFSINTTIILFGQEMPLELTLAERGNMKFPVLLGRKFLSKKFVVDSAKANLSSTGIKKTVRLL
ncbi:MAG: ATP-dependent zinc protease [Mangrovibacterium sp.]